MARILNLPLPPCATPNVISTLDQTALMPHATETLALRSPALNRPFVHSKISVKTM